MLKPYNDELKKREDHRLKVKEAQVKLLKEQEGEFKRLSDWNEIFKSFIFEQQKTESDDFKNLKYGGTDLEQKNLDELLIGWNLTAKAPKSESKSSTEGLQAWLTTEKSPDKLFTVMEIHKEVDKSANSLLIRMNLERWNFAMQLSDETVRYNFKNKLKDTLKAFCGDDNRATLFLRHFDELNWLHEIEDLKQIYKCLKVNDDKNRFNERKLAASRTYHDAHNDLYPQRQKTLSANWSEKRVGGALEDVVAPRDLFEIVSSGVITWCGRLFC
ncbi:hypothetical protein KXD40_003418 [Peronospora effusa]|nr:hypothetical protein KXD40_003418 [Peronospora effusa]